MGSLKDLKDKREEILKAELAAWLHDMGKCADEHIINQSKDKPRNYKYKYKKKYIFLLQDIPDISICDEFIKFAELVKKARPRLVNSCEIWILRLLSRCHASAHIEKEEADEEGKQPRNDTRMATPFGMETTPIYGLTDKLKNINYNYWHKRHHILKQIADAFKIALGDTRRPENEITLLTWSSIVAALYKAEIARYVVTSEKREPKNIKWRLLSIRTDGLAYLLSANSIPDMLARKELLKNAFDNVQKLLEEYYPLGLEVYRDENGSVFVVPDLGYLLDLTDPDDNYKTLREYIIERFQSGTVKEDPRLAIQGEIVPEIYFDKKSWWGQDPEWRRKKKNGVRPDDEPPPIGEYLSKLTILQSDPLWVQYQWCRVDEICSVCGLRPIGPSEKAKKRKVCDVCEQRRSNRAKEWATERLNTTIWIDEVSDKNGRIALIVGKFDLTHWLDGTLVRTLAVRNPANCGSNNRNCLQKSAEDVAKNPSFARLRRIWETTKKFWEEVEEIIKGKTKKTLRYYFEVSNNPDLGYYHAYEMHIGRVKIPVLWDTDNKRLWIIDNPEYLFSSNQLNDDLKEVEVLKKYANTTIPLYDPAGYGKRSKKVAEVQVAGLQKNETQYSAYIPILTEPQVFMAIVPADKSLGILKEIKAKYEREMGKVRNRLPLHIGVVFAPRMTPLRTILDAGRRMLKQKAKPEVWEVEYIKTFGEPNNPNEKRGLRVLNFCKRTDLIKQNPNQFRMLYAIKLKSNEKKLIWYVPALMGDGQTEDHWYPYVFLASPDEPTDRIRYYKTDLGNPWNSEHPWLVHAGELKPYDRIYFTPATFDFVFMDNNRRRFDVAYDEEGRRIYRKHWSRPYLLDELEDIGRCWETLKEYLPSSRQIFQIRDLIETKREEWFSSPEKSLKDETFKQFCEAVIRNAEWKKKPPESTINRLLDWAVSGLLSDSVEIFHHILKVPL